MSDMVRPTSPELDNGELRHTLTVEDVGVALTTAGVPRSQRQIIRYCQTGLLDAVKVPGPTGDQWYVSPASLPKAIGDLKQWEAQRARHTAPQPAMAGSDELKEPHNGNTDAARHGAPQPAVADLQNKEKRSATGPDGVGHGPTSPAMSGYVEQLEKRIEEKDDFIVLLKGQLVAKDEQIGELSTRYRETHTLLGAMQRMIAPLLGQADPYQPADRAEEPRRVDNSAATP